MQRCLALLRLYVDNIRMKMRARTLGLRYKTRCFVGADKERINQ